MRSTPLRAGEIGVAPAARLLGLSRATVLALLADGSLKGGRRRVLRTSPPRPWSSSPTHTIHFVREDSIDRFRQTQPGRLADLLERRAVRARAYARGQEAQRADKPSF